MKSDAVGTAPDDQLPPVSQSLLMLPFQVRVAASAEGAIMTTATRARPTIVGRSRKSGVEAARLRLLRACDVLPTGRACRFMVSNG